MLLYCRFNIAEHKKVLIILRYTLELDGSRLMQLLSQEVSKNKTVSKPAMQNISESLLRNHNMRINLLHSDLSEANFFWAEHEILNQFENFLIDVMSNFNTEKIVHQRVCKRKKLFGTVTSRTCTMTPVKIYELSIETQQAIMDSINVKYAGVKKVSVSVEN